MEGNLLALQTSQNQFKNQPDNVPIISSKICRDSQTAVDTGNAKGMYKCIIKPVSPMVKWTGPLKSATGATLTGKKEEMNWWLEIYSEL